MRILVDSRPVEGGDRVMLRKYAVGESYPPEYRAAAEDRTFLQHAADRTGGRLGPEAVATVEFGGDPARGLSDLWRLCVLLAGLLLPLDIALRRLG